MHFQQSFHVIFMNTQVTEMSGFWKTMIYSAIMDQDSDLISTSTDRNHR